MNKNIKKILQGISFIAIIIAFIYIGTRDFSPKIEIDNERFDKEYNNVSSNNVFTYVSASDVYTKLKTGNSIIFMAYPENEWSGYYANILNETAQELNIKEIFYYNFKNDRDNKNGTYQSMVLRLVNYLPTLDDGTTNLHAPALVVIKNGKIFSYDDETSIIKGNITPELYWTELQTGIKKSNLKSMLNDYLGEENNG